MLLIVIGIGLYYNVIIAWIIFYLIEVFISLPTGKLPWTTCGNRQKLNKRIFFKKNLILNPQLEHRQLHGHQLRAHKWISTSQQQQHSSGGVLHKENARAFPRHRTGKITKRVF